MIKNHCLASYETWPGRRNNQTEQRAWELEALLQPPAYSSQAIS